MAAATPFSIEARCARTSATRSSIPLLRLCDHAELFHPGAIHHVEHRHHPPVRHALVRLEQGAFHPAGPQHRPQAELEIARAGGDTVEVDRPPGGNLNAGWIV